MNKSELLVELVNDAGLTKAETENFLNSLLNGIKAALKKGDKVSLTGFGTFEVSSIKARDGVNPQTGEKIKIKATKVPKFRPGKSFKDAIK